MLLLPQLEITRASLRAEQLFCSHWVQTSCWAQINRTPGDLERLSVNERRGDEERGEVDAEFHLLTVRQKDEAFDADVNVCQEDRTKSRNNC